MENPRAEKVAVVAEVRSRLQSSSGAILTEYRGLKVGEFATLRRVLRTVGGEYKIYKNTLVRFAVRELGLEELEAMLIGPTAIAFVDGDAAAVAKALRDFARTNPALVVKGGLLGGNILDAPRTAALADLPTRDVLLARLAGSLAAPMQQLAGLLQALPRNLAYGLKALIDLRGGPEVVPDPVVEAPVVEAPVVEASAVEDPVIEAEAAAPAIDEVEDAITTEAPAPPAEASGPTDPPESAPQPSDPQSEQQ